MINRFKKFFSKKDPPTVFGKPLEELPINSNGVPIFFDIVCSKILNNITHKGIFRKCGDQSQIDLIGQLSVNSDFQLPPTTDVDTLTSFLKKWLRELPEPILIPSIIKNYFKPNDANTGPTAIQNLPNTNRKCLAVLFNIIKLISNHSEINLMPMKNLSVCIFPSIIQLSKTPDYGTNFTFQSLYYATISFLNDEGDDFDFQPREDENPNFFSPNNIANFQNSNSGQKRNAVNFANYNPRRNQFRTCNAKMLRQSRQCPLIDSNAAVQLQSCPEMNLSHSNEINDNTNPSLHPIESLPIPMYEDDVIVPKENSENSQEEVNKLLVNNDAEVKHRKKHHKKHNKKNLNDNQKLQEEVENPLDNSDDQLPKNNEKVIEANDESTKNTETGSKSPRKHRKKRLKNDTPSKESNQKSVEANSPNIADEKLTENASKSKHHKKHKKKQAENIKNIDENNEKLPEKNEKIKEDDDNSQDYEKSDEDEEKSDDDEKSSVDENSDEEDLISPRKINEEDSSSE